MFVHIRVGCSLSRRYNLSRRCSLSRKRISRFAKFFFSAYVASKLFVPERKKWSPVSSTYTKPQQSARRSHQYSTSIEQPTPFHCTN